MRTIYHRLCAFFKRKRRLSAEEMVGRLTPSKRDALEAELKLLRSHGVEVRLLEEGETPGSPRAVDAEVEARLTAQAPPEA